MNGMTALQRRRQAYKPKIEYIAISDGMILRKDRITSVTKNLVSRKVDFCDKQHGYQLIFSVEESAGAYREYTHKRYFLRECEAEAAGEKKFNEIMEELSK